MQVKVGREMKETDESTVLVWDFNISLTVITRTTKEQICEDVKHSSALPVNLSIPVHKAYRFCSLPKTAWINKTIISR